MSRGSRSDRQHSSRPVGSVGRVFDTGVANRGDRAGSRVFSNTLAVRGKYAESTQLLRTRYYSADSNRRERPGHSILNATAEATKPLLHVEAELRDVAVDELVVLALDAQLADFLGLGPAAEGEQLVPVDDLGADE